MYLYCGSGVRIVSLVPIWNVAAIIYSRSARLEVDTFLVQKTRDVHVVALPAPYTRLRC
jgi:hypothetical protein